MIIVGIDTDSKGSIAKLNTETNEVMIFAIPNAIQVVNKTKRLRIDVPKLVELLEFILSDADIIYLEQQNARPKQGAASTFTFGMTYGIIIGISNAMSTNGTLIKFVTGAKWKNAMGLTRDKKKTVATATLLAPDLQHAWKKIKYTSAAEAFLIALYGCGMSGVVLNKKPLIPVKREYDGIKSLT